MTSFRVRRLYQTSWTLIVISGPATAFVSQLLGGALMSADLQVQQSQDGEWVNLAELEFHDGVEIEEDEE